MTATTTRDARGLMGPLTAAEAAPAAGVIVEGCAELLLAEVRPERVQEDELRVGELPQEEVRDPQLAGRADQKIGIRHLGRVQVRRECVLVDRLAAGDGPVRGVDKLGAPAVVESDPQVEVAIALRLALECRHALAQRLGRTVTTTDEARADSLAHEVGKLPLDRLREDLHQKLDLLGRAPPVLGGERIDGERLHTEIDCGLHRAAQRLRAGPMAGRDRQPAFACPAGVAVHDDRDGASDIRKIGLARRPHLPQCSDLREEAQTSMISASLWRRRSSIVFVWSSVSFCTRSSARCSSSLPTSLRSLRCCTASRRTFRTATLPSSAILRTTLTSSLRRSSVG